MKIANVSQFNGAGSCAPMAFNGRKKQLTKQIVGTTLEKVAQHSQGKLGAFYGTTKNGINVTVEETSLSKKEILALMRDSQCEKPARRLPAGFFVSNRMISLAL